MFGRLADAPVAIPMKSDKFDAVKKIRTEIHHFLTDLLKSADNARLPVCHHTYRLNCSQGLCNDIETKFCSNDEAGNTFGYAIYSNHGQGPGSCGNTFFQRA